MNDINLTPALSKKLEAWPRTRGRYNSSELYPIFAGWVTPEKWMNPPTKSPFELNRMWSGVLVHDHVQRLLPKEGNEVKREYYHNGIVVVAKVDHLPDFEESVWEIKTSMDEMAKPKAWAEHQAKTYCSIFERPVCKVFQPVSNDDGLFLKLIGEVKRDDEWFERQLAKLWTFHERVEKLWEVKKQTT